MAATNRSRCFPQATAEPELPPSQGGRISRLPLLGRIRNKSSIPAVTTYTDRIVPVAESLPRATIFVFPGGRKSSSERPISARGKSCWLFSPTQRQHPTPAASPRCRAGDSCCRTERCRWSDHAVARCLQPRRAAPGTLSGGLNQAHALSSRLPSWRGVVSGGGDPCDGETFHRRGAPAKHGLPRRKPRGQRGVPRPRYPAFRYPAPRGAVARITITRSWGRTWPGFSYIWSSRAFCSTFSPPP
jgi:hypothetical protein